VTKNEIPVPAKGGATTTRPAKKKIETALPLGKIIEKTPVAPIPKETSSLPAGTFCSRCGNRVPFKSTFCNHCGTPVSHPPERATASKPDIIPEPAQSSAIQPVIQEAQVPVPPPLSEPVISEAHVPFPPSDAKPVSPPVWVQPSTPPSYVTRVTVPPPAPQPRIPETPVPVPPASVQPASTTGPALHSAGSVPDRQSTQINRIIQTIEPLIEDSVPRTQHTAPLVQKDTSEKKTEPAAPERTEESRPPVVMWPVLSATESPGGSTQETTASESVTPPPQQVPGTAGKKPNYLAIVILIIAILPIVAGLVIMANIMSGPSVIPVTTSMVTPAATILPTSPTQPMSTPIVTDVITPGPSPVMIPPNGVWVRALYQGSYIGLIGTAGNQLEVSGTGDKFYPISTIDGIVAAALQKKDGSGDKITLEVYKNGVMLKRESTVTPRGIVEIQLDLKTLAGPGNSTP
jgi:hypothetical protein